MWETACEKKIQARLSSSALVSHKGVYDPSDLLRLRGTVKVISRVLCSSYTFPRFNLEMIY